jgi:hypothetical protein
MHYLKSHDLAKISGLDLPPSVSSSMALNRSRQIFAASSRMQ